MLLFSQAPAPARVGLQSRVRCSRRSVRRATTVAASETPAPPVVFVAGATGRTGVRVVRELLSKGYLVRAGVRDTEAALRIFRGEAASPGVGYTGTRDAPAPLDTSRISCVRLDVTQPSTLAGALGDAKLVVSCLGAPESQALNPALPRAVDGEGTSALVAAAKAAQVEHFVLVSSLGTGRFGWPASILNLFWGVLQHKRDSELALIASGVPFTVVRPGGMERPTDDFRLTHGVVLCREDTRFGGLVSRSQVAEVCVACLASPGASANKVVEVVAEEGVPVRPLDRQLDALPRVVAGRSAAPGSPEAFTAQYAYSRGGTTKLLDVFAFAGSAPEVINSRIAMISVLAILWMEAHGAGTLYQQCDSAHLHPQPEAVALAVAAASLPPLLRGVSPKDAELGAFRAATELLHGRLAMLALAAIALLEFQHGVPVWQHPWPLY